MPVQNEFLSFVSEISKCNMYLYLCSIIDMQMKTFHSSVEWLIRLKIVFKDVQFRVPSIDIDGDQELIHLICTLFHTSRRVLS